MYEIQWRNIDEWETHSDYVSEQSAREAIKLAKADWPEYRWRIILVIDTF